MQAYPGQPNPVLAAIRGDISTRQLRVMVEHLPPDNPVAWHLGYRWGDIERLLHDISSQLRLYRADFYNAHRDPKKSRPMEEPELIPTPEEVAAREAEEDHRTPEQKQAEQAHLQLVLNRPNPR